MIHQILGRSFAALGSRLVLLVAMVSIPFAAPALGEDSTKPESLDVFILVDVSRSMYLSRNQGNIDPFDPAQQNARPGGSDPERQRWDAVRLLLDLLTADDRVTLIPFNEHAPARFAYSGYQPFDVPGTVADSLRSPRSEQDHLSRQVEEFAHNRDFPAGLPTFQVYANKDLGGTGIFVALQEAHRRAAAESREIGRKPVILLLTDGDDTELNAEERQKVDQFDSALLAAIRGRSAPRDLTPVHTMGLGGEAKASLLERIAKVTGGSYHKIGPATELVPTFRNLIWSLKYCWIKSPRSDVRRSREGLEGILDLGILSSRSQSADPFTREARRPSPASTISAADFLNFPGQRRSGNQGKDYLYEYFGPLSLEKRRIPIDVDWSVDPPGDPRAISFSKRTDRPLFTLTEPSEGIESNRLERLPISVKFNQTEPFRPEQFHLWYSLRPAGTEPRPEALLPMDANFRARATFPRTMGGASPRYTLRVEAEGIGDPSSHPLAGYRLILPEKTIQVGDKLRLIAIPPVLKLAVETPTASVRIEGVRTLVDDLKLQYRLEPPVKKGVGPISPRSITVKTRPEPSSGSELTFQGGSATIDLALGSGTDQPELGAEYDAGSVVISAGPELGVSKTELKVPIQLRLRPATLSISSSGPIRSVYGGVNPPPPVRLKVEDDGGLGLASRGMKVAVSLKKVKGDDFADDELWIEPVDAPALSSSRTKTLTLALGQEFRIGFNPSTGRKPAAHEYLLDARLSGKDQRQAVSAQASVSVEYEHPRLELSTRKVTSRVPKSGTGAATVQAFLRGPVGMRTALEFRPDPSSLYDPSVEVSLEPCTLAAGEQGGRLTFDLKVAPDASIGVHTIRGSIHDRAEVAKEASFELEVVVDELRIADPLGRLNDVQSPIPIELWWDSSHQRTLELSTALGGPWSGPIRIAERPGDEAARAFESSPAGSRGITIAVNQKDNDNEALLLPRRAILKPADKDAGGRSITVEFPAVKNVEFNRRYRVFLVLTPGPESGLAQRSIEFVIIYRRTDDLRRASP